jgi:hypothetical protein
MFLGREVCTHLSAVVVPISRYPKEPREVTQGPRDITQKEPREPINQRLWWLALHLPFHLPFHYTFHFHLTFHFIFHLPFYLPFHLPY